MTGRFSTRTAVMTNRAFDIRAGSGPAVRYLVRHAAAHAEPSMCPGCPRCLETPVLNVLETGALLGAQLLGAELLGAELLGAELLGAELLGAQLRHII